MNQLRPTRYGLAVLFSALGTLACWLLAPLGASLQLVLFFPVIVLSALLAGLGPGILATILCTIIAVATWTAADINFHNIVQLCVFSVYRLAFVACAVFARLSRHAEVSTR